MAQYSEYIERKHRIFFRYFDDESKGRLYRSDMVKKVDRLSAMNITEKEESAMTRYRCMRHVDMLFLSGRDEDFLTEDTWIDRHRVIWASGLKYEYSLISSGIYYIIFDRLDANRDGQISHDELKMYYRTISSADDNFIDQVFRKLDEDQDGHLTRNEFMKAGADFWFGEDPSTGMEIFYNVHN